MRVLFINPGRENEIIANNPSFIEEERGFNPPLGLLYLAAYLRAYSSHQLRVIDAQVERLSYDSLKEKISGFNPDVVAISAMTLTLVDVVKTIAAVKAAAPSARVALGGPHTHLFPEETINLDGVDYVVMGEGEKVFKELLDNIGDDEALARLPGLAFRRGKDIIITEKPSLIEDLDGLPYPARDLVPYKKYNSLLCKGAVATTIFTSRGCPFQCSFCDRPHLGKRFRARSARSVVGELEECVDMGISDFLFYDDTFTVDRGRVLEICRLIIERKLKISWDIRARVDTVDEEVLKSLKAAGCGKIHYGVEAGTEKILKVLNKQINLAQVERVFKLTQKYGILVLAYFMIGSPGETRADIMETFRVMKRLSPDYVHLTILTPFPGTKIYREGLESGVIKEDVWRVFARNPRKDFLAPHWPGEFARAELIELLLQGYKSFYTRPGYIFKRLLGIKSFEEFKKNLSAGMKVLGCRRR